MATQDRRLLLLRNIVRLRVKVEGIIADNKRGGDDVYAEEYNTLCSWALALFEGSPLLEGKLVLMPDAVTKFDPLIGTDRLLARVSYLESSVALILGVDPSSLPEARGLSKDPPSQAIHISHSTVQSVAANLQGTQVITASQVVSNQWAQVADLLRQLRSDIEASAVGVDQKYDALKDTEAIRMELEKKQPRFQRVVDVAKGIGEVVITAAPTVSKLVDLLSKMQIPPST